MSITFISNNIPQHEHVMQVVYNQCSKMNNTNGYILVDRYVNGPEYGFYLQMEDRAVVFGSCRDTDEIVIYFGFENNFDDRRGLCPDQVTCNEKTLIQYGFYQTAATLIIDWLFEGHKPKR